VKAERGLRRSADLSFGAASATSMTMTRARSQGSLRRLRPLIAATVAIAVLAVASAWYGLKPVSDAAAQECIAAAPVTQRLRPLARGEVAAVAVHAAPKPAPAVAFNDPGGQPMTLADRKGKTVLVNLWATWCVPCRQEMPALDELQAEFGGDKFEVVAINVDTRNAEKPRTWLKENGIERLAYYADPEAKILQTLQRTGHVIGLPTTILVDENGCELGVLKGPAEWASEDAKRFIRAALAE
jgi:thiol-disulfide isomerase/thioredoxin